MERKSDIELSKEWDILSVDCATPYVPAVVTTSSVETIAVTPTTIDVIQSETDSIVPNITTVTANVTPMTTTPSAVPTPASTVSSEAGKLSDLNRVFERVAWFPCDNLVDVHKLIFMTDSYLKVIRNNLLSFKGFSFDVGSPEFQRRKMYLKCLTIQSLRIISNVLITTNSVDLKNSTKQELESHLTDVLAEYCNTLVETDSIVPNSTTMVTANVTPTLTAYVPTVISTSSVETIAVTSSIDAIQSETDSIVPNTTSVRADVTPMAIPYIPAVVMTSSVETIAVTPSIDAIQSDTDSNSTAIVPNTSTITANVTPTITPAIITFSSVETTAVTPSIDAIQSETNSIVPKTSTVTANVTPTATPYASAVITSSVETIAVTPSIDAIQSETDSIIPNTTTVTANVTPTAAPAIITTSSVETTVITPSIDAIQLEKVSDTCSGESVTASETNSSIPPDPKEIKYKPKNPKTSNDCPRATRIHWICLFGLAMGLYFYIIAIHVFHQKGDFAYQMEKMNQELRNDIKLLKEQVLSEISEMNRTLHGATKDIERLWQRSRKRNKDNLKEDLCEYYNEFKDEDLALYQKLEKKIACT